MVSLGKNVLNFFILAFIVGVLTFLLPQSIGLSAGGFDETFVLQQFSFYLAGGIFLALLVIAFIIEIIIRKGDTSYGNSIAFNSPGETPSLQFFKRFTPMQITFLSVIIFGFLGLFSFITKQNTFTGIGAIEQQFTPTAQMLFSAFLVPGSENLGLALVLATGFFGLRIVARRTNMSSANFRIFALFILPILGAIYWLGNHLLRYATQDIALTTVFFFGLIMSLLVVLTGTFIVGWIMHISNNLFFDLQRFFNSDTIMVYSIISLLLLLVIYFFFYKGRLLGRKRIE